MGDSKEIVDREVFDTFFKESYCKLEYDHIKDEFEEIANRGLEELFADGTDYSRLTKKNFILYLRGDVYCEFEEIVESAFDALNTEITDAVMDVSVSMDNEDEITETYWDTCQDLLVQFLQIMYDEKIAGMLTAAK